MKAFKFYLLLALLCGALYVPGMWTIPIIDRDSAHFAQATRQMLETGNYFQIRYQDITRFQKPPGINWLQAIAVKVFSSVHANAVWPYRIPSLLGGLFSVLLTFAFTQRFCGNKVALLAAALLACSLLLTVESHMAVIDASLLSSVVLMQGALWVIYDDSQRNRAVAWPWALLFWLAMSYGFLLKGVTPLVGVLTIVALVIFSAPHPVLPPQGGKGRSNYHRWFSFTSSLVGEGKGYWLKHLHFAWGIPLFLLSCCWLIGVSNAEHNNYLMQMWHKDLLPKLAGGHESHGLPFGAHAALLTLTLWPTSLFLWQAGVRGWRYRQHAIEKFLLAWIIPTWIFFEIMPTKLPQYVLPTFPAIAILAALAIVRANETPIIGKHWRWLTILYGLWGIVSLGLGLAILWLPGTMEQQTPWLSIIIFCIIVMTSSMAVMACVKRQFQRAALLIILGSTMAYAPWYYSLLPNLKNLWLSEKVTQTVAHLPTDAITDQQPLLSIGYAEPSLVFDLGTHRVKFVTPEEAVAWFATHHGYLLIDAAHRELWVKQFPMGQPALAVITGFNYSNGHWVKLTLYKGA